jgi:hypothetical protein
MNIFLYLCNKKQMIHVKIDEGDIISLQQVRYSQAHPRVMQKYDALRLKNCGLPNSLICKVSGICLNTLLSYFKQYNEGGLTGLQEINFYCPKSELQQYSSSIEKYFEENPPSSIRESVLKIEELTGIKRSETQVRKFMKDSGFRFR